MLPPCTGVILAGGAATRFGGRAKGLERVGGRPIVERVAGALREASDSLLLVANDAAADQWLPDVRRVADVLPGHGSLGGIHAALVHAGTPVLLVAWDMPFVPPALLRRLRDVSAGTDVVVPESGSRRGVEPLCAWYGPACVGPIERALSAGDRRVVGFFHHVRVARLPADEVSAYGHPEWMFMNVNDPGELARAEAHAASTDGGHRRP